MDIVIQMYRYNDIETNSLKSQRQNEINFCFKENTSRAFVNKVHVILSNHIDEEYFKSIVDSPEKLIFYNNGHQPTYAEIYKYIINTIPNDTIVCVMNSDIYLDPDIPIDLISNNVVGLNMFGLTRHEYSGKTHEICNTNTCHLIYNYMGSADAFITRTPIIGVNLEKIDFKQNIYGAEAILQKNFSQVGYNILNPAFQVKIFHVHKDSVYFEQYKCIGNHHDFMKNPSYI